MSPKTGQDSVVEMKSRIVAAGLGLLVAACSPGSPEAEPRIAILTSEGVVQVIDITGAASEAPVSAAVDARLPIQPTPGPGGRLIWVDQAAATPTVALFSDGATISVGTPFPPFYFSWSPDGNKVAMLGNGTDGVTGAIYELATEQFVDLGSATPFFFDWAPDGSSLIAHLEGVETHVIDVATGQRSLALSDSQGFAAPQYLPDGRVITVRATTGSTAAVMLGHRFDVQLAQAEANELIVTDLDEGTTRVLTRVSERTAFAAAGDRVAFVTGAADGALLLGGLELVDLEGSGRTPITEDEVLSFEWSPDGSSLLYFTLDRENATVTPNVWDGSTSTSYEAHRPTELVASQYLPFADQYARSQTGWSADGSAFTYAERTEDGSMIVIQVLDGDAARPVAGLMSVWMR